MKIEYKFNKSNESKDCIVESVELEVITKTITPITLQQIEELLEYEVFYSEYVSQSKIQITDYNIGKGWIKCETDINFLEYKEPKPDYELKGVLTYTENSNNDWDDVELEAYRTDYSKEYKSFTSQQELKSYINSIQESIEFIAESDIDQVLIKEWVGEWEYVKEIRTISKTYHSSTEKYKEFVNRYNLPDNLYEYVNTNGKDTTLPNPYFYMGDKPNRNLKYINLEKNVSVYSEEVNTYFIARIVEATKAEIIFDVFFKEWFETEHTTTEKTGSPKLNSNWTFKIK